MRTKKPTAEEIKKSIGYSNKPPLHSCENCIFVLSKVVRSKIKDDIEIVSPKTKLVCEIHKIQVKSKSRCNSYQNNQGNFTYGSDNFDAVLP